MKLVRIQPLLCMGAQAASPSLSAAAKVPMPNPENPNHMQAPSGLRPGAASAPPSAAARAPASAPKPWTAGLVGAAAEGLLGSSGRFTSGAFCVLGVA